MVVSTVCVRFASKVIWLNVVSCGIPGCMSLLLKKRSKSLSIYIYIYVY